MEFPNAKSKHDFFTQQTYCVGQSKHHQPLNLDHYLCTLKYMCTYIQGCQTGLRIDSALSEEGQIFAPKFLSGKIWTQTWAQGRAKKPGSALPSLAPFYRIYISCIECTFNKPIFWGVRNSGIGAVTHWKIFFLENHAHIYMGVVLHQLFFQKEVTKKKFR